MTIPEGFASSQLDRPVVVLVAPNISRRMGGEALKALQIHQELRALGVEVYQVTHERVQAEVERDHPDLRVTYVSDGPFQILLHKAGFGPFLVLINAWQLHRAARRVAKSVGAWLVHFTSPISPVLPYFALPGFPVVIGPLNGNIFHPPAFADRETKGKKLSKWLLKPTQWLSGMLFAGKKRALILAAGGDRTLRSLMFCGCSSDRIVPSLDCGIPSILSAQPKLHHKGFNSRFVFVGRLIRLKGCDLAIRAVARADPAITLDIIGDGPERPCLEQLAVELGVRHRVSFVGWVETGKPLFHRLCQCRALVMPTLAEANGISVQEAMMLGLPVICVDWGGPALLLTPQTGILIVPKSARYVVEELAKAMCRLALDPSEAETLSTRARAKALGDGFDWRALLLDWIKTYDRALAEYSDRSVAAWLSAQPSHTDDIEEVAN